MILQVLGKWVGGPICVDLPGETQSFFIPIRPLCLIIKQWRVERSQTVEQNPIWGKNHECSTAQESTKTESVHTNKQTREVIEVLLFTEHCISSSSASVTVPRPPSLPAPPPHNTVCEKVQEINLFGEYPV